MKIVAISDTHNYHERLTLPEGDVLVHAGDATIQGSIEEVASFAEWFKSQPHKYKVLIAGNHDFLFERSRSLAVSMLGPDVIYLDNSSVEIEGITFYGSAWQPEFHGWAFGYQRGAQAKAIWSKIPAGIDVLVTHGPPHGIRDARPDGLCIGCHDLAAKVREVKPKVHIFGHLHHEYGQTQIGNTLYVNAAICDESYDPCRVPLELNVYANI